VDFLQKVVIAPLHKNVLWSMPQRWVRYLTALWGSAWWPCTKRGRCQGKWHKVTSEASPDRPPLKETSFNEFISSWKSQRLFRGEFFPKVVHIWTTPQSHRLSQHHPPRHSSPLICFLYLACIRPRRRARHSQQ
jgi:hypothetical protein